MSLSAGLKPVVGIHLLCYDLFEQQDQALWCFEMRDAQSPAIRLGRELQLNIVELPKADRLATAGKLPGKAALAMSALNIWITYFQHGQEEKIMSQIAYPPVMDALRQLRALSADEETRRLAEVRELALMTERAEIEAAKAEGEAQGEARGQARAMAEALARLIESGIPEAQARIILRM